MSERTSTSFPRFGSISDEDPILAFDGAAALLRAWGSGLKPDPLLTVSEWTDRYRTLSSRAAAEPGRYRTKRTPYMKDIMDALSPGHPAQRIVFMKAAQVGATEAGNCFLGFIIHQAPGPALAVQPTVELAKRNSRQRIDPLIEESAALRDKVKPARSRDAGNTMLSKEFAGGILIMTGANSAVGLRSTPARYIFLDEVDAYPASADEEGDPVTLAEARSLTFAHRRKVFMVSTPTIRGLSRIEREYEASDQRRYFVPCPHCGAMQCLQFERLRWDKGRPDTAAYHCEACEKPIAEHHKTQMLERGEWRATAVSADPHSIGFHLSALYSPLNAVSPAGTSSRPAAPPLSLSGVNSARPDAKRVWTETSSHWSDSSFPLKAMPFAQKALSFVKNRLLVGPLPGRSLFTSPLAAFQKEVIRCVTARAIPASPAPHDRDGPDARPAWPGHRCAGHRVLRPPDSARSGASARGDGPGVEIRPCGDRRLYRVECRARGRTPCSPA